MRRPLARRLAALTAGAVAVPALVASTLVAPASAMVGLKITPTSGPVGAKIQVSGKCGSTGPGLDWMDVRIGLYFKDAFVDQYGQRSVIAITDLKPEDKDGGFAGSVTVPARGKYTTKGPTAATPGPDVEKAVSGKIGVEIRCIAEDSGPVPMEIVQRDDVFTVDGKDFTVTKKPSIKGKKKVGKTLRAKVGTWSPKPASFAYQWKRGKKDIPGATKKRYTVQAKDAGKKLRVLVTGRSDGFDPRTVKSKKVKIKESKAGAKRSKKSSKPKNRAQERRERLERKRDRARR